MKIPSVTFKMREGGEWIEKTSKDLFSGKKIVVFALPGAFTPICSSTMLPAYEKSYAEILRNGVDDVYCLSVNDAFVMNAWAVDQDIQKVKMIPDGNGTFTRMMGMLVDKSNLGFGMRSWRYSMLVDDRRVRKTFVEPEFGDKAPSDPFEVSDAETMITYLETIDLYNE
jgi:peroxiredoxin